MPRRGETNRKSVARRGMAILRGELELDLPLAERWGDEGGDRVGAQRV